MLEALTGIGLSASAGLNAWIPLLALGLLNRYTDLITLPQSWAWLSNGWILAILGVLLAIEIVADKVPLVDSANDVIQTVIRPTSGGLAFGASSDAHTVTVSNPGTFFSGHQWVGITFGALIALFMHVMKSTARPVINTLTLGAGGPVVSTLEDTTSAALSIIAIVIPILVIIFVIAIVYVFWRTRRRLKRRRAARAAAAAGPAPP
jgi:hypothetical protein